MKTIFLYTIYIALGLGLFYNAAFGAFVPISQNAGGTATNSPNNPNLVLITSGNGTTSNWVATSSLGFLSSSGTTTIIQGTLNAIISSNSTSTVTGSAITGASPIRVQVQGKYAYVLTQTGVSLEIYDISTSTPSLVSSTSPIVSVATGLAVRGDYAYVIDRGGAQIKVVNVSNPKTPFVVTTVPAMGGAPLYTGFIYSHYLYVVAYNPSGLVFIYDIFNPSVPVLISIMDAGISGSRVEDIYVVDNFAYEVESGNNTMVIWNVSNPYAPVKISSYTAGAAPNTVYVTGSYAYIGTVNRIETIDVSDKNTPVLVNNVGTNSIFDLELAGRFLFGSYQTGNVVELFNLSTTSFATPFFAVNTDPAPKGLWVDGRFVYVVTSTNNKLQKIDLTGIETTSAIIHSLHVGALQTTEDINTKNVIATGYISSGIGGIFSVGSLAISSTNTPSSILSGLIVGTTTLATSSSNVFTFRSSTMVVQATSSASVPLTLMGYGSQLTNLFQVQNSSSQNLFYLTSSGGLFSSASSTFGSRLTITGGLNASSTATSTFQNGLNLNTGCFAVLGACVGSSGGTINAGATGQFPYYSGAGTTLTATSSIFLSTRGMIGIGSTSPWAWLSIVGTTTGENLFSVASSSKKDVFTISYSGTTSIDQLQTGTLSFFPDSGASTLVDVSVTSAAATGVSESYTLSIDASSTLTVYAESDGSGGIKNQRIGIGSTTPWGTLSIEKTGGSPSLVLANKGGVSYFIVDTNNNVGVATETPAVKFSVQGNTLLNGTTTIQTDLIVRGVDIVAPNLDTNITANALCILGTGEITGAGASACVPSALRFKKNIQDISSELADKIVMGLKPVSYTEKNPANSENPDHFGFIADWSLLQDRRLVDLHLGEPWSFEYMNYTAVLTRKVQDQDKKIKELELRLSKLENK